MLNALQMESVTAQRNKELTKKKCQNIRDNMVEKGSKNSGRGLPPPFRAMPERKHFFYRRASLTLLCLDCESHVTTSQVPQPLLW